MTGKIMKLFSGGEERDKNGQGQMFSTKISKHYCTYHMIVYILHCERIHMLCDDASLATTI